MVTHLRIGGNRARVIFEAEGVFSAGRANHSVTQRFALLSVPEPFPGLVGIPFLRRLSARNRHRCSQIAKLDDTNEYCWRRASVEELGNHRAPRCRCHYSSYRRRESLTWKEWTVALLSSGVVLGEESRQRRQESHP